MAKRDDDFESDEEENDSDKSKYRSVMILGIVFLIIIELFFYLLSSKTGSSFGIGKIFVGIFYSIIIVLFLLWVRFLMLSNKYAGAIIGVMGTGAMIYALTRLYQGTYTTIFAVISLVLVVGYIVVQFLKVSKR